MNSPPSPRRSFEARDPGLRSGRDLMQFRRSSWLPLRAFLPIGESHAQTTAVLCDEFDTGVLESLRMAAITERMGRRSPLSKLMTVFKLTPLLDGMAAGMQQRIIDALKQHFVADGKPPTTERQEKPIGPVPENKPATRSDTRPPVG